MLDFISLIDIPSGAIMVPDVLISEDPLFRALRRDDPDDLKRLLEQKSQKELKELTDYKGDNILIASLQNDVSKHQP